MEKVALYIAFICCLTISPMVAHANAQADGVKAKIPFDFAVAGQNFPAGEYTMDVTSHRVDIRNANGRKIAILSANEISGRSADENGFLLFQCHGERCFLSEVWSPSYENGLQIPNSRREQKMSEKAGDKVVTVRGEENARGSRMKQISPEVLPSSVKHN